MVQSMRVTCTDKENSKLLFPLPDVNLPSFNLFNVQIITHLLHLLLNIFNIPLLDSVSPFDDTLHVPQIVDVAGGLSFSYSEAKRDENEVPCVLTKEGGTITSEVPKHSEETNLCFHDAKCVFDPKCQKVTAWVYAVTMYTWVLSVHPGENFVCKLHPPSIGTD